MNNQNKIPRIIKINWIQELSISVDFDNGETRVIDFLKVLKFAKITESSPGYILYNIEELEKVKLEDDTLSWHNVSQYITSKKGEKIKVPFQIGADILLKFSDIEKTEFEISLSQKIKEMRIKSGLTQQELAIRSGIPKSFIIHVENKNTKLDLIILKKLVETGLGKSLKVDIQ